MSMVVEGLSFPTGLVPYLKIPQGDLLLVVSSVSLLSYSYELPDAKMW